MLEFEFVREYLTVAAAVLSETDRGHNCDVTQNLSIVVSFTYRTVIFSFSFLKNRLNDLLIAHKHS